MSVMDAVHRFYQVYNDHNASLWEQAMAPSYIGHVNGQTIPSREVGKGFVAALLTAFLLTSTTRSMTRCRRAIAPRCAGRPPRPTAATSSGWRPRARR